MSKAAPRSLARAAPRMSAALTSPASWTRPDSASIGERVGQAVILSFLLAFSAGVATGARQTLLTGGHDPLAVAGFSYRTVGSTLTRSAVWTLEWLPVTGRALALQNDVVRYLCMPYQYCAFAGAYAVTAGIGYVQHVFPRDRTVF